MGNTVYLMHRQQCCNQMRFASIQCSKMRLGCLQRSPGPLAGFKRAASLPPKGEKGKGKVKERRARQR